MKQQDIENMLHKYEDPSYLPYLKHVIPGNLLFYGVRMNNLRRIASKIIKENQYDLILTRPTNVYEYEIILAILAGRCPSDHPLKKRLINETISTASNWCTIDTLCSNLNPIYPTDYDIALAYLEKDQEFEQRFGYVLLLMHFSKEHSKQILNDIKHTQVSSYYSMMAKAWCIAECAIYEPKLTHQFLKNEKDIAVKKKAISKICDSKRFTKETKDYFKSLREGI